MAERMSELEAEAARAALQWRRKYGELWDAVDVFLGCWEVASSRRSMRSAIVDLERVWRGEEES